MPKGVKGSGTSTAKRTQPRKIANETVETAVRSSESIFGSHGIILDRIILNAKLASIIERNLSMLASELKAFDAQTDNNFGAKVLEKVIHAGVTALTGLSSNPPMLPADREHGLLSQITKKE